MRLQILTFIFLAICLGLLALFAIHEEAQSTPPPTPHASDSTPSQYRL